ncbi:MAG: hypothetical protein M9921_08760 [Fimbriimonadaceae bacterium]|nr:hypothetical protein [Fimbriimonadaceae bacterium]
MERLRGLLLGLMLVAACGATAQEGNLGRSARASASEFQPGLPANLAVDGTMDTRWSGIPGHNSGVWFQLEWGRPVEIAELLVRQYGRYTFEWDVETWDDTAGRWMPAGHFGKPNVRLPGLVLCPIQPARTTSRVRIANITNGPSFTEVEVYGPAHRHLPEVHLASDLRGNFVGILCDSLGAQPLAGHLVDLEGNAGGHAWSRRVETDEHGMFFAPMPVGLRGMVRATSLGATPAQLPAIGFQRAVTPLGPDAQRTELAKGWRFALDPPQGFERPAFDDAGWSPIAVPAHWEMEGFRSLSGRGGYRVRFPAPPGSGRALLRFDGVYSGARVWLNGTEVARHEGGFTPFEADVTHLLRPENVLALEVVEHTNVSDNLDKMSQYADFPLAGIIRKVTLVRVPSVHVEALEQSCTFAAGVARVEGTVRAINRSPRAVAAGGARLSLLEPDGTLVARTTASLARLAPEAVGEGSFALTIPNPRAWSAESPTLYTLRIELTDGRTTVQTLDQRIGLRETRVVGSEVLINGRPVKFRGTCHHDSHPLLGRAVTPALTRQDLRMMREANLNAVRTSHYPPIPELVEDADEMGLYVEDEADFCWVGVADDLRNVPRILQLTGELLARDRNHPSVFMWSLCNESEFGFAFERSHEWVRRVDPSRPTGAAISAPLEIATLHNPISVARIAANETLRQPLFFDEAWCIFQGIFGDVGEMWVDPGIRDYYAAPLQEIYRAFMQSKATQGSMIWCWADDLFCVPGRGLEYGRDTTRSHFADAAYTLPGRGIVGDAPWGVVDGWRRRKPEFWIVKKLHSPVKMRERQVSLARDLTLEVSNEYDFTNLSAIRTTYAIGDRSGTLHLDVPPRSSGRFTIPAIPSFQAGEDLRIVFRALDGGVIDEFRFPTSSPAEVKPTLATRPIVIREESVLAGQSVHLVGDGFELAFDRGGGFLRRCVRGRSPLLLEFPAVHVLRADAPEAPLPGRNEWRLEAMDVKKEGVNVRVVLKGRYREFEGGYDLLVSPEGEVTVRSRFQYTGEEFRAREVGMRFSVPRACDTFSWHRLAEWGAYPSDHIGRPVGTARAFPQHGTEVPPNWAWSQDLSPMGSNDFRSTKRNVVDAEIAYPDGVGVRVWSGGKQSVRAMVETDRISVHVNDWYGGTHVGWNEWISNYGAGKLVKTGDVIESTLRLRL